MQVLEGDKVLEEICQLINDCNHRDFRILIGGPVNSGKSTLGRNIVNALLESGIPAVGWIDCDIGQPEFTPPTLVSFHTLTDKITGTPLEHLRHPERGYFIGSTTPKTEIQYYLECIRSLLAYYEDKANSSNEKFCFPVIINTNGWVKGNGGQILSSIIDQANPDVIVQLLTDNYVQANRNLVDYESICYEDTKIFTVRSYFNSFSQQRTENEEKSNTSDKPDNQKYIIGKKAKLTAKDMRDLLLMKYFNTDQIPLSYIEPYAIKWNKIRIRFIAEEVPCSMAMYALNGMVVGLCTDKSNYKFVGKSKKEHEIYPSFLLSTPICNCVGLGIIRAIDPDNHLFHIITPLPLSSLKEVNTIMKGNIELPTLSLLEGGVMNAPYLCSNSLSTNDGSGAAPMNKKRQDIQRHRPE